MNKKIQVKLKGLFGLLPIINSSSENAFIGILPDMVHGVFTNPGKAYQNIFIPPHVSALKVRTDSLSIKESTREPDLCYRTKEGQQYYLFVLNRERLTPKVDTSKKLDFQLDPIDPNIPSTGEVNSINSRGLQWMPNVKTAEMAGNRNFGGFDKKKFLNSDFTPVVAVTDVGVAGTVVIDTGELYVGAHRNGIYDFKVPGCSEPEWRQYVFRDLYWDLAVNSSSISFDFKNYNGESSTVTVNTTNIDPEIEIVNLELESLLGIGMRTYRPENNIDFDTSVFYSLLKNPPKVQEGMPLPHLLPGRLTGSSALCIPMMFN